MTATSVPTRPIESIHIGQRHRRDLGDLDALAAWITEAGCLLHPVVIKPDGELVAGERRLEACKLLGWSDVPVHVVDIDSIARGEFIENIARKDFTPSEMVAIVETVEQRERELARQRMSEGGKVGKLSTPSDAGKTRDKVAAPLGVSGRTLEKAKAVVEAGQRDPERFGHLVEEMDRCGKVTGVYRKLSVARDEDRIFSLAPAVGKFRTLVIDPPWKYDGLFFGRGGPDYAAMDQEALLKLPVADWAEDNAHVYLWTTNAFLFRAGELLEHWGLQFANILTWTKPHFGMGILFRNSTEHVLFATRGKLATRRDDIGTHFAAPVGSHSEKPEKFYDIVRAASYPPYGEAFQRKARPDFRNLFAAPVPADDLSIPAFQRGVAP